MPLYDHGTQNMPHTERQQKVGSGVASLRQEQEADATVAGHIHLGDQKTLHAFSNVGFLQHYADSRVRITCQQHEFVTERLYKKSFNILYPSEVLHLHS